MSQKGVTDLVTGVRVCVCVCMCVCVPSSYFLLSFVHMLKDVSRFVADVIHNFFRNLSATKYESALLSQHTEHF